MKTRERAQEIKSAFFAGKLTPKKLFETTSELFDKTASEKGFDMYMEYEAHFEAIDELNLQDGYTVFLEYGTMSIPESAQYTVKAIRRQTKNRKEEKNIAKDLIIGMHCETFKNEDASYGECYELQIYAETIGRAFGFLREFRENAIC